MKIVQVAPDYIPVPPAKYGGIERVVYDLTEELVRLGHEVILYAMPGTKSQAQVIKYEHTDNPFLIRSLVEKTLPQHTDIVHDHTHSSIIGRSPFPAPVVSTIHVPRNNPVSCPVYPSWYMHAKIGNHVGYCIHHGLDPDDYQFSDVKEDYLLFIGRLIPEKGIMHALDLADRTGQPLVIAGPETDLTDAASYEYYANHVLPRIQNNPEVHYVGEVGGQKRQDLLKHARCVLFLSDDEAFGLVMIEAMACGTPVLALGNGAVPEIMEGIPELICHSVSEMIDKVQHLSLPEPHVLRRYTIERFTSNIMAQHYLNVYRDVTGKQ